MGYRFKLKIKQIAVVNYHTKLLNDKVYTLQTSNPPFIKLIDTVQGHTAFGLGVFERHLNTVGSKYIL